MIRACRAELINLSHRPVVLILALFATVPTIYGYIAGYASARAMAAQGINTVGDPGIALLLPHQLVQNVVVQLFDGPPPDGAAVGIVLGALVVGSDYGWGTVRTVLVQGPGRLAILSGRLVVLATILAALIALEFLASGAGSVMVAVFAHAPIRFPQSHQLIVGMLSVWLIVGAWASLGVFLAIATRGPTAAMGVGIAWEAGIEATIQPFAAHSAFMHTLVQWLPKANTAALVTALTPIFSANESSPAVRIDPAHATLILVAYSLGFLALAGASFRRDID